MARAAILACGIAALLALSSCRTPQHTSDADQKAELPPTPPASAQPEKTPPPAPAAIQPASPSPVPERSSHPATPAPATPAPSSTSSVAPAARPAHDPNTPTAGTAVPKKAPSPPTASEPKAQAAPAAAPTAPKASSLDLSSLEQRLKDTRAIGIFTKLSLKNQVDDLLSEFRAYHKGAAKTPQAELRQKYDLLIFKVLSLLQNGDPQLASAIASSREAIWGILMDPQKFANI